MLDKIAIIALIIILIIFFLTTILTYLIILGADELKTAEEKEFEDQEQMEYLRNYKNKRKGKR